MLKHTEKLPEFGAIPTSLIDVLSWRAEHEPDRIAYVFLSDGETNEIPITYGELHRQAQAIAGMLQERHSAGQRSLLVYPPGLEFLAAFLGCLYAGVVAVPVYPPRKDKDMVRILAVIENSGASSVLTVAPILKRFEKLKADDPDKNLEGLQWLVSDQAQDIMPYASMWQHPGVSGDDIAFLQYTSGSTGLPKGVMISHTNLIYTQRMIATAMTHTKDCVQVSWLPFYHDMGLIGNILHALYMGLKCYFMSPESFLQKPFRWLDAITRYKATTAGGAPNFAFEHCIQRITLEQREQLDLSNWKFTLVGSDPVRHKTLERFAEVFGPYGFRRETFYPGYGLAEATLLVSGGFREAKPVYLTVDSESLKYNKVAPAKSGSKKRILVGCGRTVLEQKIKIVDPYSLRECDPNSIGEIWVSGENIAKGYWDNEEQSKKLLKARLYGNQDDLFLRTGDFGFLQDEELYVTGRVKNLIVIRGRNHYPHDIEVTAEESVKALREGCSAVFTVEKDDEEKLVIVAEIERRFLSERRRAIKKEKAVNSNQKGDRRQFDVDDRGISQPDPDLALDDAISTIRQAVAENHGLHVHGVVFIRPVSIPKTTSGKIRRLDCREQFLNGKLIVIKEWIDFSSDTPERAIGPKRSKYDAEAIKSWLLSRLAKEFKMARHQINPKVELFRYGLDSLAAVSISGELEEWSGCSISPSIFYNYPTVQAIVDYLAASSDLQQTTAKEQSESTPLDTPVAIIGAACRFPGADSLAAFWRLLQNAMDVISEVPADRWDVQSYYDSKRGTPGKMNTRWGGFLNDINKFDPLFFGISPREATFMDPQQRILLEVSWEALENAGLNAELLVGSKTGVFIGISNNEYSRLTFESQHQPNAYQGIGNSPSIAANRISYQYDWRGPSISIDTACSSSLVSVHLACQSLRTDESNLAVAGGVNLVLTPEPTLVFSNANMMAGDGRCKTFDSSADGYVRSEGCGLVILKLLPDAIREGDEILAVIKGSAVNQDGRSNGITAPNGLSQQAVITQAMKAAQVAPSQIHFVEAHGTGTFLGDSIELESLKMVLMQGRSTDNPCLIGSVKTNIGHLESAAGIAGLLKTALVVKHGQIPTNLHFKTLNPHISFKDTSFSIPSESQPWPESSEKRIAGVSSFGFGGTNAHLIIEEHKRPQRSFDHEFPAQLFTLSAKSESALTQLINQYIKLLEHFKDQEKLAHLCYSANRGRTHFLIRLAIVSETPHQLLQSLKSYQKASRKFSIISQDQPSHIVFIFPDRNTFHPQMGKSLYQLQPTFKNWIDLCDEYVQQLMNFSLVKILYEDEVTNASQGDHRQLLLFSIEYSLAQLWISWGIEPDMLVGNGIGEIVAATLSDIFNLETGLKIAIERDDLLVDLSREITEAEIDSRFPGFTSRKPTIPLLFVQSGDDHHEDHCNQASYWLERKAGDLERTLSHLEDRLYHFRIVMGKAVTADDKGSEEYNESPKPLLSLSATQPDWKQMMESLGFLYTHGVNVDWRGVYQDYNYLRRMDLPNYPFQKEPFWIDELAKPTTKTSVKKAQLKYELTWKSLELPAIENLIDPSEKPDGYWLIFVDQGGVGSQLAINLSENESTCILVSPGTDYKEESLKITIDPANPEHFQRLLAETGSNLGSCLGIVHLWSLNDRQNTIPNMESLVSDINLGSLSVLYLVQAMSHVKRIPSRGMWLVTSNTQNLSFQSNPSVSIGQSTLWGLGKGIALEFSDIKVGLVDLGSTTPLANASFLQNETVTSPREWQVVYRNNQRFVARIKPENNPKRSREHQFKFKADATYVITGGLGKIGLKVAEYLISQGARNIALVSRSKLAVSPDKETNQSHPWHVIQSLKSKGVTIHICQADISDQSQLQAVLDEVTSKSPKIAGIFHAAGVVSKRTVSGISEQELMEVFKAKVFGTWVLHNISISLDLDCFVLFSSISSIWGSRGISHYAAANAFLDSFATFRKSLNLPVLSINWGPWVDGAMTAQEDRVQMARMGIYPLDSDAALQVMHDLLDLNVACQIVTSMDWNRFKPLYGSIGYGNLFEDLSAGEDNKMGKRLKRQSIAHTKQGAWNSQLVNLSSNEKAMQLSDLIRNEIARIMRSQPSDINNEIGFFDLGMDSLMAIELKDILEHQLDLTISDTLIFDYPNLNALTQFLLATLKQEKTNSAESLAPLDEIGNNSIEIAESSDIASISEDEISRLIDEELEDI